MIKQRLLTLLVILVSFQCFAQYNDSDVSHYIQQYKDLAMAEQVRSGVPAAITLAQGIFETAAGSSELCTNAHNHFGIKCKSTWTGATYTYTDDAKDECFRSYNSDKESYKDHSDFLRNNKRYSILFTYPISDYKAWAKGLKQCGYATNNQYAAKLIQAIEKYNLSQYTLQALALYQNNDTKIYASASATPGEYIPQEVSDTNASKADYYQATTLNGLPGFYARKGDLLLEYAIKHRIRYAKLLEYNDLKDEPLNADMFIYTEKKFRVGKRATHVVAKGESLQMISQEEAIQLQQLLTFNHLANTDNPIPNSILYLQSYAPSKPQIDNSPQQDAGNIKPIQNTANSTTGTGSDEYISTSSTSSNNTDKGLSPKGSNDNSIDTVASTTDNNYISTHTQQAVDTIATVSNAVKDNTVNAPENTSNTSVNIANEPAIEETVPPNTDKNTDKNKNLSPIDRLKAQLDQSVYAGALDDTQQIETPQVKPTTSNNNSTTKQPKKTNITNSLQEHMQDIDDTGFTPQSNSSKQLKVKNGSSTPAHSTKKTTSKPVHATPHKSTSKTTSTKNLHKTNNKKPVAKHTSSTFAKKHSSSKTNTAKKHTVKKKK